MNTPAPHPPATPTAANIETYMESLLCEEQRQVLMRFFKTGPGEYGEGDEFLGLKVPETRAVARLVADDCPLAQVPALLHSRWHEVRLCGLLLLVHRYERLLSKRLRSDAEACRTREAIISMYLSHARQANNWDLVDLSAPKLLGAWVVEQTSMGDSGRQRAMACLDTLAGSSCLWLQRISMVATLRPTQTGDPSWCLRYAEWHLAHPHPLMHKATGWMLREMGKHCGLELLRDFLSRHACRMARTTLRYAIERMDEAERRHFLLMR